MIMRMSTLAVTVLTVAACKPAQDTEPQTRAADAPEPISIVRADADIDLPVPEAVLEPLELTVPFADGGDALSGDAREVLDRLISSEELAAGGVITLRGHTDAAGSDTANLRASQGRADAVADWLMEKGVAQSRIRTIAFGEQNPVKPNALPNGEPDEAARAANRRVEVMVSIPEDATAQSSDQGAPTSLVEQVASGES
ncbi:OmpA family protein [Pontixanthobacter sp.]|uniref:OmpA family protein n=1 Tax=Pontixanthobacter sp. TaxID=2792078 RepID=UPI003C7EA4F4